MNNERSNRSELPHKMLRITPLLLVLSLIGCLIGCVYSLACPFPFGFIDKSGRQVIDLYRYCLLGLFGFGDASYQLRWAYDFSDGMALCGQGFVDAHGNILSVHSNRAGGFSEGLALVPNLDGVFGYINSSGDYAIKPRFEEARNFSQGLAAIEIGKKWGYIDRSGEFVIPPTFDDAQEFSQGLAGVRSGKQWGVIDRTGRFIIPPQYDCVDLASDGIETVCKGDFCQDSEFDQYYLDLQGKRLFSSRFQLNRDFDRVTVKPDRNAFYTERGYDDYSFSDGLAIVQVGSKFGYMNKSFKVVITPAFDYAQRFSEGLALVYDKKKDACGYIDHSGKQVIPYQFAVSSPFREGLAVASNPEQRSLYGYIDKTGRWVISPKFNFARPFSEGKASVAPLHLVGHALNCTPFDEPNKPTLSDFMSIVESN